MNKQEVKEMIHSHETAQQVTANASRDVNAVSEQFKGKDNTVSSALAKISDAYLTISKTHAEIAKHVKSRSEG